MKLITAKVMIVTILLLCHGNLLQLMSAGLTDYGAIPPLPQPQGNQSEANRKLDFHTDLFTGRFSYSIPIIVPPARQGSEPGIVLQYNSSGGNGWCGVGWDLEMGSIQRETKKGVPVSGYSYTDSAGFTFSVAGQNGSLINVGNSYWPQFNTAFLKFSFSNGWWTATDKSGTRYSFGENANSRIENSGASDFLMGKGGGVGAGFCFEGGMG